MYSKCNGKVYYGIKLIENRIVSVRVCWRRMKYIIVRTGCGVIWTGFWWKLDNVNTAFFLLVIILLVSDSNCADEMNGEAYYGDHLKDGSSHCFWPINENPNMKDLVWCLKYLSFIVLQIGWLCCINWYLYNHSYINVALQ